ncbi:hypothetical protein YC2023_001244 [Brassica napus]
MARSFTTGLLTLSMETEVDRRGDSSTKKKETMPLSATMVGALLGLGTQMYSNALRKLPYMRRKSTNPKFNNPP